MLQYNGSRTEVRRVDNRGGVEELLFNIMPIDGRYNGDIKVSIQNRMNNSSMSTTFKRPLVKRTPVGIRLSSGANETCISNKNIDTIENVMQTDHYKSFIIYYGEAQIYISVVIVNK